MILADEGQARDVAASAARLAGLSTMPEIAWADAPGEMVGAMPAVLIAEAVGIADALLAPMLPMLATLATEAACAIVLTLEAGQIDLVSAFLLDDHVQLLCDPTLAERAAALVVARAARGGAGRLRDPAGGDGGGEAERLAALAREIARIGAALAELAARHDSEPVVADRTSDFTPPPPAPGRVTVTAAELRGTIRSRRLREAEFGAGWFEDPAWDILLDLFAAELEEVQVSVSSLCIAAAVAPTTALRWITRMTAAGLLVRRNDARDRRRAFMHLSDRARAGMIRYFAAARQVPAAVP